MATVLVLSGNPSRTSRSPDGAMALDHDDERQPVRITGQSARALPSRAHLSAA